MNRDERRPSPALGFTLTELTVVLVIVALMLGGLLMPLNLQTDQRDSHSTATDMAEIREVLLGFAVSKGRLPCPAIPTLASTANNAGVETLAGATCAETAGVLPWRTLGIDETDAWGRRYTYMVTGAFAKNIPSGIVGTCANATQAGFTLCSSGDLDIITEGGFPLADDLPVVVISHGKNGNGAYTPAGTQIPRGNDSDENDNQLGNDLLTGKFKDNGFAKTFVKKVHTPGFDDQVVWISTALLFNRMVSAGKLP